MINHGVRKSCGRGHQQQQQQQHLVDRFVWPVEALFFPRINNTISTESDQIELKTTIDQVQFSLVLLSFPFLCLLLIQG